jgi:hypothetical protein
MFNIHMLREEWTEIATAWALEELMKEMGTTDVMELHRVTGLSPSRIQNAQSVLRYPREWQERVFEEEIPYQLLVELDKAVLGKARRKPELVLGYSEEFLRDAFLKKYVEGFLGDVVDMRKVSALIRTASEGGFAGEQAKVALRDLVENPATRIEDAYEAGAAASVELGKVLRDINNLPQRLGQLFATDLDDDHKAKLLDALSRLRAQLEDFLEEFGSA